MFCLQVVRNLYVYINNMKDGVNKINQNAFCLIVCVTFCCNFAHET